MSNTADERRELFAELARLTFDAEAAVRKAIDFADENGLTFALNVDAVRRAPAGTYGWQSSSYNC